MDLQRLLEKERKKWEAEKDQEFQKKIKVLEEEQQKQVAKKEREFRKKIRAVEREREKVEKNRQKLLKKQTMDFQAWVDQKIETAPMLFTNTSTTETQKKKVFPKEIRKWENFNREVLKHIETFGNTSQIRGAQDFASSVINVELNHDGIVRAVSNVLAVIFKYEELLGAMAILSGPCNSSETQSGTPRGAPRSVAKAHAQKSAKPLKPDVECIFQRKSFVVMECKRPIWFRESDTASPGDLVHSATRCQRAATGQLYRYMIKTCTGFGVLTSLDVSYFIRRCKNSAGNDYDILEISDGIRWTSRGPSFLGAMHYLLFVAKSNMGTSYTADSQPVSARLRSGTRNKDDNGASRDHGHYLRSEKRERPTDTFGAKQPGSKRHGALSLGLQEFAEEDLKLEEEAFAKGWSGNIVRGEYHGHRIAVKLAPVKSRRQRALEREGSIYDLLQDLWGKYIPALIAHGTTAGGEVVFLATEFVFGSKLSDAEITPALATEARAALSALHSHGILHGDLHSGNILVLGDGVRFIDFGFSKRVCSRSECEAEMKELEGMIQRHSTFYETCETSKRLVHFEAMKCQIRRRVKPERGSWIFPQQREF